MSSHLTTGKLNISLLQEEARKELLNLIDNCHGSKVIVWDVGLSGPFGLIAEYSVLKEHNAGRMYHLGPGELKVHDNDVENIIFIARSLLKVMNDVVENVLNEERFRKKRKWHLFFVPNGSLFCEEYLKSKGVFGSFSTIKHLAHCCIFPLDNDLLSMEVDTAFKDYFIDGDPSCLYQIAKTIMKIEELFGPVKRMSGNGNAANDVMELVKKLKKGSESSQKMYSSSVQIDQLVLIDRSIDYLSVLSTPLIYSGLIDELYGINNCMVRLPAEKFSKDGESSVLANAEKPKKEIKLNSSDEVYADVCDKSFDAVGKILNTRVKQLSTQINELNNYDENKVRQMKQYVQKMPQFLALKENLSKHLLIAELIKEEFDSEEFHEYLRNEHEILLGFGTDKINPYIEDCMARKVDITKVLRLICIQSVVNCGLKPKVLEQYKRDVVQSYGFRYVLTLSNLEKVGLLKIQQGSRSFVVLKKTLKLIEETTTQSSSKDIHFVHGVYAPLTVRLAQQFAKPSGWRNLTDIQTLLPGSLFDRVSNAANATVSTVSKINPQRRGSISSQNEPLKVIVVFFIGGCTYSEIAALRFLSQQEESNVEFVIATTKIINGKTFMKSLMVE